MFSFVTTLTPFLTTLTIGSLKTLSFLFNGPLNPTLIKLNVKKTKIDIKLSLMVIQWLFHDHFRNPPSFSLTNRVSMTFPFHKVFKRY